MIFLSYINQGGGRWHDHNQDDLSQRELRQFNGRSGIVRAIQTKLQGCDNKISRVRSVLYLFSLLVEGLRRRADRDHTPSRSGRSGTTTGSTILGYVHVGAGSFVGVVAKKRDEQDFEQRQIHYGRQTGGRPSPGGGFGKAQSGAIRTIFHQS